MTLRELIEVVPRDGYLTLHIEKDWYAIQVKYFNIIRPEILDMNIKNLIGSTFDGKICLDVTLESPEVSAELTEFICKNYNEEERAEIKKISKKFDIPLGEACNWYEYYNHNYAWAVERIKEHYRKIKKGD